MFEILIHCIRVLEVLIIIRLALSWLMIERGNSFSDFIFAVTEPVLKPLRFSIPVSATMRIDLSYIIVLVVLSMLEKFLISAFMPAPVIIFQ